MNNKFTEDQLSPMVAQFSSTPLNSPQPEMISSGSVMKAAGYDVIAAPSDVIMPSGSGSRDEVSEAEAVNSIYRVALEEEASARCSFHMFYILNKF